MSEIPVVILAGGLGMRIREETEFRPKPMIPIGERPILWHIMKIYAHYGFQRFIICLGYKGEIIKQYFLHYNLMHADFTVEIGKRLTHMTVHNSHPETGWTITLAETGVNAMTGARIKRVKKYVKDQLFMATYGDGVADINVKRLLQFHRSHGKVATITGVNPPSRFGELLINKQQVTEFSEKPQIAERFVNGGFFVFNPEIFDYLTDDDSCVLEKEPLERLAREGELVMYRHTDFWQCMDTIRDMNYLEELWRRGQTPWKIWKS